MILVVAVGVVSAIAITTIFEHQNTAYSIFPDNTNLPAAAQNSQPANTAASNSITSSFVNAQEPASDSSTGSSTRTIQVTHKSGSSTSSSGTSTSSNSNGNSNSNSGGDGGSSPAAGNNSKKPSADCLAKYGLDSHTIIFYYSDEPHSNAMKPIVRQLEADYGFYWTAALWDADFNSCFGTTGATPEFVCSGTGEILLGEAPMSMLESFAARCA